VDGDQQELTTSPLIVQPQPQSARRLPYLYDPATIRRILDYAAELPMATMPAARPTYATVFALLAVLGLRIGEVSRLQCGDVDLQRECSSCVTASSARVASCPSARVSRSVACLCRTS